MFLAALCRLENSWKYIWETHSVIYEVRYIHLAFLFDQVISSVYRVHHYPFSRFPIRWSAFLLSTLLPPFPIEEN